MVPLSIQLRQRSLKITALPMFASFMAATGRNAPLGQAGGHFMHSQQGISLGLISGVWRSGPKVSLAAVGHRVRLMRARFGIGLTILNGV